MAGAARGKRPSFEDEQRALASVAAAPRSDESRQRLTAALASARSLVVAKAARLIREHALDGFARALSDAFARFIDGPPKGDPSCQATLATLEALDYGHSLDAEPFLRAVRHVQLEPVDTAAGLRARGIVGLARIGHDELDLAAARLLADPLPPVRQAALEALAHRGDRAGAPLALFKLRLGDEDPLVTLAAMATLLALAPAHGLAELRAILDGDGDDGERRELAAVALGQSRSDDAAIVLEEAYARAPRLDEREAIVRGLGLHRSERATRAMLAIVSERGLADARLAVEALAPRACEPGLAARLRAAAAAHDDPALNALIDERFGDGAPALASRR